MAEDRGAASALKGRLADVYIPALVDGSLQELSRRLGNRATVDDPLFGRVDHIASIDSLLERLAARFKDGRATYRHVASATGVDRDVSEGVLVMHTSEGTSETPIAVVAERRRLREIELRVYYATASTPRKLRTPLLADQTDVVVPQVVAHVLDALRKGAVERVLAAFEETSRFVDPTGKVYGKSDGSMAAFVSDIGGRMALVPCGAADDGRVCCVEAVITRNHGATAPEPAAVAFERGDSGLLRELRFYYEP